MNAGFKGTLVSVALVACASDDLGASRQELRPTDPGEPAPGFAASDMVRSVVSPGGAFRIHFSESGPNAVSTTDTDGDGTPDAVESTAATYDEARAFYADELGMRPPLSDDIVSDGDGGDALFDVYLVDFALRADGAYRVEACNAAGACAGYMIQENDFRGYAYPTFAYGTRIVGSHELFHAVQAAYGMDRGVLVSEGTAVWATEQFDASLLDFESFIDGYLSRTDRSLAIDPTGPVPPFAYGSAIFFQFLGERYDRDIVRGMWERLATDGVTWLEAVDAELRAEYASSVDVALLDFARWNVRTDTRSDPMFYANGAFYVGVAVEPVVPNTEATAVRLAAASTRYFSAALGSKLSFALDVDGAFEPGQLQLLAFVVDGGSVTEVAALDPNVIGSASGAGDLWLALANVRPDLGAVTGRPCVGPETFVRSCIGSTAPDAGADPDGGATVSDAGPTPLDAGATAPPDDEGCGCRSTSSPSWIALLAVAGVLLRRRR